MKATSVTVRLPMIAALLSIGAFAPMPVEAQTPAQMEYEPQQREYWRAQEQQREQQRLQQQQLDNARRQQEETNRSMRQLTPAPSQAPQRGGGPSSQAPANPPQADAKYWDDVRRTWERRPPLPPERNPLLGRWAAQAMDQSSLLGAVDSLFNGGTCDFFFGTGDGFVEFRPTTMVAVGRNGSEQVLTEVAYRGGDKRVAVLPKALFKIFLLDFDSPDRISLAGLGLKCKMVRASVAATRAGAAGAASGSARLGTNAMPTSRDAGSAALSLAAGFAAPGGMFQPLASGNFFVLRESADVILAKGGIRTSPGVPPLEAWTLACRNGQPACGQGMTEIVKNSAGAMTTDATGRAQLPGLHAGTYYVFGLNNLNAQPMLWHVRADLKQGANAFTLDQRNATPLN